jgi:hypothetical protein
MQTQAKVIMCVQVVRAGLVGDGLEVDEAAEEEEADASGGGASGNAATGSAGAERVTSSFWMLLKRLSRKQLGAITSVTS